MKVPFIDLKRTEQDFMPRWLALSEEISKNYAFIGGAQVESLERNLTHWTENSHCVSCANGTDALQLALRALGIGAGDLVAIPDATFWATFEAVVNVGATPCTVAVSENDGGMSFESLESALSELPIKAVIVVHLYGWGPARLADMRTLCKARGIPLLEDGAQSFATTYMGKPIYKDALISTTSFYPAKVLGAAGDGGAVFTNDAKLAETVRKLSNHGRTSHYEHGLVGWNSRLDSLQAAYVNLSLDYLQQRVQSRRSAADWYRQNINSPHFYNLKPVSDYVENGYCNVNLIDSADLRQSMMNKLKENGIGYGNIYPMAMSDQPGAVGYLHRHIGPKTARTLSEQVLNLPLFPYITEVELNTVKSCIAKS